MFGGYVLFPNIQLYLYIQLVIMYCTEQLYILTYNLHTKYYLTWNSFVLQEVLLELVQRLASLQHYPQCNFNSGLSPSVSVVAKTTETATASDSTYSSKPLNTTNKCDYEGNYIAASNIANNITTNNFINNENVSQICDQDILKICSVDKNEENEQHHQQSKLIKDENSEEVEDRIEDDAENEMGSNVSRHSGKGLSGRRTQSSGNSLLLLLFCWSLLCGAIIVY